MRITTFLTPMVLICLAGSPLLAEQPRYGLQGALAFPTGDLADSGDAGLQIGGHALWDLRQGMGIMARVDLTSYGRKDGYNASSFGAGADFLYHFDGNHRGLYAMAGLNLQNVSRDVPYGTIHDSGLGVDLGLGYDIDRNFGLQARFNAGPASLSATTLGVTYTF